VFFVEDIIMSRFDLVALDADDTLWHNERLYEHSQDGLASLLEGCGVDAQILAKRLYQTETRNIGLFGFGIKSFTLSMIETAVELTEGHIEGLDVLAIIDLARAQLNSPVELLEHVSEVVPRLTQRYPLMIITKGDLQDQETRLQRPGLGSHFPELAVVPDKTLQIYTRLFASRGLAPERLVMVGNALRSDILPILQLGGNAVYIPYPGTWLHEAADPPSTGTPGFYQLEHLGQLPNLLDSLESDDKGPSEISLQ
jgi:putative hydrolase of the HAD superfamily